MEDLKDNKRKVPDMVYIFFSFVPWIVYWILCGMGNVLGIIIPSVIVLLLIIPQIRKRDFNLMDVTSLLYFSIVTAATFIFNLNIFVEKSGFFGYSALFLMALLSLIIKQPYTLQVSKRDYPEIYIIKLVVIALPLRGKREDFVFNTGVEDVSGLWERGPVTSPQRAWA